MDNGFILFLTLGITIIVGLTIQYILWQKSIKAYKAIDKDWESFLEASSEKDIKLIKLYGDKLLWNQHLKQEQLDEITEVIKLNIDQYPELEKMKANAYNKQLDYNRGW